MAYTNAKHPHPDHPANINPRYKALFPPWEGYYDSEDVSITQNLI